MHRDDLVRIDAIFLHHDFSCKVADGDDDVGGFHATTFYRINESIDILSRTVELCGVHVNYERFSCRLFCRDASGICQPVVSVNHIEFVFMFESERRTDESVTRDFFHEVSAVFTGELISRHEDRTLEIIGSALFFNDLFKTFRSHVRNDIRANLHILNSIPIGSIFFIINIDSHIARIKQADVSLIFIAMSFRNDEQHIDAVLGETFCHSETSCAETSGDMRRKFPAKHQHFHNLIFSIRQ